MKLKKQNTNDIQIIMQIISLLKNYKNLFCISFFLFIISTIIVFFQPLIVRRVTDKGMLEQNLYIIIKYSFILLIFVLLGELISVASAHIFAEIHNKLHLDLSTRSFNKLLHLKLSYYTDKNSAEILDNMKIDVSNVASITDQSFEVMVSCIFRVLSGLAGLIVISWKLTIVVAIIIPIKFMLVEYLSKKIEKITEEQIKSNSTFSRWFSDNINGIQEIKLWGLLHNREKVFREKQMEILKNSKSQTMLNSWNAFAEMILEWFVTVMLYVLGGIMIIQGTMTIGGVFAFVSYSQYVTGPIVAILNLRYMISYIMPSARRLFEIFNMEEEKENNDNINLDLINNIKFKNVSYSYDKDRIILKNINFQINKGEKVAIIGSNGSGKTTLINLLLLFLEPNSGSIEIDGNDIRKLNIDRYRSMFAVVSQNPYLFLGSIRENINLDERADENVYKNACRRSGANTFIAKMPNQDDSIIGQNGSRISGGEKKKIAIARAIIKDSPFIIMDEATAGIDEKSDNYLYDILDTELKEKTLIIITHSYSHLKEMNHVYSIEDGTIRELNIEDLCK